MYEVLAKWGMSIQGDQELALHPWVSSLSPHQMIPFAYIWLIQLAVAAVTGKGTGQAQVDVSLQGNWVLTGAKMRSQKTKSEKGLGPHIL